MRQWVLNKLLTIIMASFSAGIAAETLSVPQNGQIKKTIGEQTLESNLSLPQRGLSKEQVLESLGEPAAFGTTLNLRSILKMTWCFMPSLKDQQSFWIESL